MSNIPPPKIVPQLMAQLKTPNAVASEQPFPPIRNFVLDVMSEGRRKNIINLLCEADLHTLNIQLAEASALGHKVSVTSYLGKLLAETIAEDKTIHAYRKGRRKLVIFNDIDLAFTVEREYQGDGSDSDANALLPIPYIVRAANEKTVQQIHAELQMAKSAALGSAGPMSALEKYFFLLPRALRSMVWFFIRRDPYLFKQLVGTVGVTSMGMFASGAAVVIPISPMTLTLSIGSLAKRLVFDDQGAVVMREYIQLNLSADHDVIDGAPLMRFAERFRQKIQNAGPLV